MYKTGKEHIGAFNYNNEKAEEQLWVSVWNLE